MHYRLLIPFAFLIVLSIQQLAILLTVNNSPQSGRSSNVTMRRDWNNCCVIRQSVHGCPLRPIQKPCPQKFLIFLPYGNFNNALRMLIQSLMLAEMLDRSVLIVDSLFSFDWHKSLEYSPELCIQHANRSTHLAVWWLQQSPPIWNRPLRMIYWDDNAVIPSNLLEWLPVERVRLDGKLLVEQSGDLDGFPRLACVAQSVPKFENDFIIGIPNPFFTGMHKSAYMQALSRIKIPSDARSIGEKFISQNFNPQFFVGVHLRWFEGACEQFTRQIFGGKHVHLIPYLDDALQSCDMSWGFLSRIISANGLDPVSTPIFLATDNQRPNVTESLLAHSNVKLFQPNASNGSNSGNSGSGSGGGGGHKGSHVDNRLVDMFILTKSSLFIGHPLSSLSFHVALWRELDGWPARTNILAGYADLGYLHHLFNNFGTLDMSPHNVTR